MSQYKKVINNPNILQSEIYNSFSESISKKYKKSKVNENAASYRQRMKEKGYRHVAFWIKKEIIDEVKKVISKIEGVLKK